jgi:hypothetical protein
MKLKLGLIALCAVAVGSVVCGCSRLSFWALFGFALLHVVRARRPEARIGKLDASAGNAETWNTDAPAKDRLVLCWELGSVTQSRSLERVVSQNVSR